MEALEARIARLEQLIAGGEGASGRGEAPEGDAAAQRTARVNYARQTFGDWLKEQHKPGQTLVVGGFIRDKANASSAWSWDGNHPPHDLKRIAAVCGALASEARLGILRELSKGRRSTAELMAAVKIDRGQLYHHLKDLFLQGLVEQPERGTYASTASGQGTFMVSAVLSKLGHTYEASAKDASVAEFDMGDEGDEEGEEGEEGEGAARGEQDKK